MNNTKCVMSTDYCTNEQIATKFMLFKYCGDGKMISRYYCDYHANEWIINPYIKIIKILSYPSEQYQKWQVLL